MIKRRRRKAVKRGLFLFLILVCLPLMGQAVELDLSNASIEDLLEWRAQIDERLKECGYEPPIELKSGSKGEPVQQLQERLRELNYFSQEPSGTYGEMTAKAVKAFQSINGLKTSATASVEMQELLFSDRAKPMQTPTPKPTRTPKPTETPKVEPEIPLEILDIRVSYNSIGSPEIYLDVKNTSYSKTIDAFEFEVRCENTFGDAVKGNGFIETYNGIYQENPIKPQRRWEKENWYWSMYGFDTATRFYVQLTSIHTTAGETIDIPMDKRIVVEYKK